MQRPEINIETEKLLAVQLLQEREIERLLEVLRQQRRELAQLRGEDADQAELELIGRLQKLQIRAAGSPAEESAPAPRPPQRGHGPTLQPELMRADIRYELPKEKLRCMICKQHTLEPLADQTEDSEEITIELKRVMKLRHQRVKYRCRCNGLVITAPGPRKLIPGGRYSLEFAVAVGTAKIVDHFPLHRQAREMRRHGLEVTTQTLWDQERALAEVLRPTYEAIRDRILASAYLHADETGFLLTEGKSSQRQTLWVLSTPELAWYTLARKDYEAGLEILGGYEGTVIADGYRVYEQLSRAGPLTLAHCWAHVLRKFRDAHEHRPVECAQILELIGKLYNVEREAAKERPGDLDHLAGKRDKQSRQLIQEIKAWALSQTGLPRSDFIKAVKYMLERWEGLTRFLVDPRLPLDNNHAERALRGPVVGRKNYLQFRSTKGCEVGAILYSLCESARLQGKHPHVYLRAAAERAIDAAGTVTLPSDI